MYSKLITPQSRALYHGGLSRGRGRGRQLPLSFCPPPPPAARTLSDVSARRLLGSPPLAVRAPPSFLGGGINCCQPPFHTPDNKREPPWQCLRKINKLPEPLQLNTLAYFAEMFPGKKAGPP